MPINKATIIIIMFNIISLKMPRHLIGKARHREALSYPNLGPKAETEWLILLFCVNKGPDVLLCCLIRWVLW